MPDVRPKIYRPIHDKSHKISIQIRIRKRSSCVERNENSGKNLHHLVFGLSPNKWKNKLFSNSLPQHLSAVYSLGEKAVSQMKYEIVCKLVNGPQSMRPLIPSGASTNGNFPFSQRTEKTILVGLSGRRYFRPRVSSSLSLHALFHAWYIFHASTTQVTSTRQPQHN